MDLQDANLSILRINDLGWLVLSSGTRVMWKSVEIRSLLTAGATLNRSETLYSPNLKYALALFDTGIKISTMQGHMHWSQSGLGLSDCQSLKLLDTIPAQLEIKDSQGRIIWNARPKKAESHYRYGVATSFSLQDDGSAALWWNRERWWTTSGAHEKYDAPSLGHTLHAGQILLAGDSLVSNNGAYRCTYRYDGSLAITNPSNSVIWSSKTEGRSTGQVTQQRDGNLVIMDRNDRVIFSGTGGYPERYYLETILQDDGELVTMVCGWKIWGSKEFKVHNVRGPDGLPFVFQEGASDRSHFTPAPMRPDWIDKAGPCPSCGARYCTRVHW